MIYCCVILGVAFIPVLIMAQAPVVDASLKCFTNCLLCIRGELVGQDLYFSSDFGTISPNYYYRIDGVERIDLGGRIVSPGYLDLQTNGMQGIHFTQLAKDGEPADERKLETVSKMEVAHGVTGWWATVPTVEVDRWAEVGGILLNFSEPSLPLTIHCVPLCSS